MGVIYTLLRVVWATPGVINRCVKERRISKGWNKPQRLQEWQFFQSLLKDADPDEVLGRREISCLNHNEDSKQTQGHL